jgi:hypothetical protein
MLKYVIYHIYGISNVECTIAIRVAGHERIRWSAVLENVIDHVDSIANIKHSISIGIAADIYLNLERYRIGQTIILYDYR